MNELTNEYETPEVFELGAAETLTHGHLMGDWPDLLIKWTFAN